SWRFLRNVFDLTDLRLLSMGGTPHILVVGNDTLRSKTESSHADSYPADPRPPAPRPRPDPPSPIHPIRLPSGGLSVASSPTRSRRHRPVFPPPNPPRQHRLRACRPLRTVG